MPRRKFDGPARSGGREGFRMRCALLFLVCLLAGCSSAPRTPVDSEPDLVREHFDSIQAVKDRQQMDHERMESLRR